MLDSTNNNQEAGFTVVELTISITIMAILIVGLIGFMFNSFGLVTRNGVYTEMSVDSQNLLRATAETLRYGAGVRENNTVSDPNQPGGWNTSNSSFVIIISIPALDSNKDFIISPDTGEPYLNELVYYKDGTQLKKRVLANTSAVGNRLTTTCPESSATPTCPADTVLVNNLKSMDFTLYDQDNNATSNALLARSVNIDLVLEKRSLSKIINFTNSTRVTLRNNFL